MTGERRLTHRDGRSETGHRSETQNQSGRIPNNDFWRYLCCCRPDRQMVNEVALPLTTRTTVSDRKQGRDSDRGDRSGTHSATLVTGRTSGWHGSSRRTLRGLLQEVVKLDVYQNDYRKNIHNLYNLYPLGGNMQGFTNPTIDQEYQMRFHEFPYPDNVKMWQQQPQAGEWGGFLHFRKQSSAQGTGRVALNIQPDYIPQVTQYLVQEMNKSNDILHIKAAYTVDAAVQSLDNIVIYYQERGLDNSQTMKDLQSTLESYTQYTRPGNPAMMQTFARGMAFAEEEERSSFGTTRIDPIVAAIEALKARTERTNNVDTLLEEVKGQFEAHGINSENPHLHLHISGKGKGKAVSTKAGKVGSSSKY